MRNILRIAAVGGAAASLALAAASAAGASTLGGSPSPHGTPPPVVRHHHPRTHQFCFASLLTETDTLSGHQITGQQGDQGGKPAPAPTQTIVNGNQQGQGQGQGDQAKGKADEVVVVQLVKVCETIGPWGKVRAVTATDESAPFAWVSQGGDQGGHPAGLPGQIEGLLKS